MAGAAPEGSQFNAQEFDDKMNELIFADGKDWFTSYDEAYDSFEAMVLQEKLLRDYAYGPELLSTSKGIGVRDLAENISSQQQSWRYIRRRSRSRSRKQIVCSSRSCQRGRK